ncbi:MAG: hypothetical protein JW727_03025 [Candidatus Aenigmarchaeota archaeon]|nr:hypothetical protein [Candidatus Aenigmarchaeota archaeon]
MKTKLFLALFLLVATVAFSGCIGSDTQDNSEVPMENNSQQVTIQEEPAVEQNAEVIEQVDAELMDDIDDVEIGEMV